VESKNKYKDIIAKGKELGLNGDLKLSN